MTDYAVLDGRLQVPGDQVPQYLAALASSGALPSEFQAHTQAALEQRTLFESERDRQRRLGYAREKDLAVAIRAMRGIENAMVQYDEIEQAGFNRTRVMTACVAVLPREGHVLDRQQIRTIRQLVAWAKAGLSPEDVNVTDLRSGRAYVDQLENVALVPRAEEYLQVKLAVERAWQLKIRDVLRFIPESQVAIDVDLPAVPSDSEGIPGLDLEPTRLAVSVGIPESYLSARQQSDAGSPGEWRHGASQGFFATVAS